MRGGVITDRITNVELQQRIQKDDIIINTLKRTKLEYFGHVKRGPKLYPMLQNVMKGKIKGKPSLRGRTNQLCRDL